jgi:hypothetical protein
LVELARDAETKQSLPNQEGTVLEQFDQDVIAGIVKRFSEPKEEKL